jgi:hypothetical protein
MFRHLSLLVAAAIALTSSQRAQATTISAPSGAVLQRNQPAQPLQIMVTGPDLIAGMTFVVQIADGGPGPETQGLIDGPDISSVDIVTGTIFGGNNQGADYPGSYPQFAQRTIITQADTSITLGDQPALLATILLDTTGVAPGTYDLLLGGSPLSLGRVEFYDAAGNVVVPTIVNGSVTVVPEPSSLVLSLMAAVALLFGIRKQKLLAR